MSYKLVSPIPVTEGGTGAQTFTAYGVICGGTTTTNPLQSTVSAGTTDHVLISNGGILPPSFVNVSTLINLSTGTGFTGSLQVNHGGTGTTTLTDHSVMVGSGTSPVTPIPVGTNGQILIAATAADPAFATITSTGGTVGFTLGANTLNLEVVGGGLAWSREVNAAVAMEVNHGYVNTNVGITTFTLPATSALGSTIIIAGESAALWTIAQNGGQNIQYGNVSTTVGVGGSLAASNRYDTVTLFCRVANTTWSVESAVGILSVV